MKKRGRFAQDRPRPREDRARRRIAYLPHTSRPARAARQGWTDSDDPESLQSCSDTLTVSPLCARVSNSDHTSVPSCAAACDRDEV